MMLTQEVVNLWISEKSLLYVNNSNTRKNFVPPVHRRKGRSIPQHLGLNVFETR